jgi:hypothetical protein
LKQLDAERQENAGCTAQQRGAALPDAPRDDAIEQCAKRDKQEDVAHHLAGRWYFRDFGHAFRESRRLKLEGEQGDSADEN